ncbi:MAG: hypothetical protein ABEJ68_08890 [Halobacteriaceae archaeon]
MVSARTATAVVGLVASLALSVALWVFFDTLALFLVVPFVPLLARRARPSVRECPECGFRTRDPRYDYCPHDGTELD